MIHHIMISCENDEDYLPLTEPPERYLRVELIGGVVHLSVYRLTDGGVYANTQKPESSVAVPVGSLQRALQVLVDDDVAGLPEAWQRPEPPETEQPGSGTSGSDSS